MTPAPTRRGLLALAAAAVATPAAPIPAATAAPPVTPPPAPPPAMRWLPTDYQDEWIGHTCGDPTEWLIPRGTGHVLADYDGEEPEEDADLLTDGAIFFFDCVTEHGTGTLTVHPYPDDDDDGRWERWTLAPPMPTAPPGAQMHLCQENDVENCSIAPGDVADYLDPGTYAVRFYAWGSRRFRYDAAAGAMVPAPPDGGAP